MFFSLNRVKEKNPLPILYHLDNFQGQHDVIQFIKMAQKLDLLVLLRPGPFIDAERDMGGLPSWLLGKHRDMKLRTSDPR